MRTVSPATGFDEVRIAEEQEEYRTIVGAVYPKYDDYPGHAILTRWRFTAEERQAIANGEDLYMMQLTFGNPFTPVAMSVGCPAQWIKGGNGPEGR